MATREEGLSKIDETWTVQGVNLRTAAFVCVVRDGLSGGLSTCTRLRQHQSNECPNGHDPSTCFEDEYSSKEAIDAAWWESGALWRAARRFDLGGGPSEVELRRRRNVWCLLNFGYARLATEKERGGFIGPRPVPDPAPTVDEFRSKVQREGVERVSRERATGARAGPFGGVPWPARSGRYLTADERRSPDGVLRARERQIRELVASSDWGSRVLTDAKPRVWAARTHGRGGQRRLAAEFWSETWGCERFRKGHAADLDRRFLDQVKALLKGMAPEVFAAAARWAGQSVEAPKKSGVGPERLAYCIVELERDLELEPGSDELTARAEAIRSARYYREWRRA